MIPVNGVSFDIECGETMALIGESGSGKSIVANAIIGLHSATDGTVRFDGEDTTNPSGEQLETLCGWMQMMFQDPTSSLMEDNVLEVLAVIVLQEADLAYADVRVQLDQQAGSAERNALITDLIDADLIYSVNSCLGDHDLFVRTWHATLGEVKSYIWSLFEDQPAVAEYDITSVVKTWKAWDRELDRPEEN